MKKQTKQLISKLMVLLLFIAGVLTMTYPFYVNELNNFLDQKRMESSLKKNQAEYEAERQRMLEENEQFKNSGINPGADPFNEEEGQTVSEEYYQQHMIGKVNIPKLALEIPLFDTTNNELLEIGATVLQGTSYPVGGGSTHSVISAHRGLPQRELFTNLPKLTFGDIFLLEVLDEILAYEVREIEVVEPHETSSLKIVAEKDLVTLVTCTPYMINSHRLLVTGERIPYSPEIQIEKDKGNQARKLKQWLIILSVVLLVLMTLIVFAVLVRNYRRRKKTRDLIFTIKNGTATQLFGLYNYAGKKPKLRNKKLYQESINSKSQLIFNNIPMDSYTIKLEEEWLIRVKLSSKKLVIVKKVNHRVVRLEQKGKELVLVIK